MIKNYFKFFVVILFYFKRKQIVSKYLKLGQEDNTSNYINNGAWMNTNSRYIENTTSLKSSKSNKN